MVMVSSTLLFPPFLSPSPSPSQSQSPFASHLVCYAFPKSRSQSNRPTPHWKGKHRKDEKMKCWKADSISDQEAIHQFDQLLAAKNIRQINNYLKDYTKINQYPTVFSLFTQLTQVQGINPNRYTYEIWI